ncbi:hypothetical protein [Desmospora profundinema]|uniref:Uncharacterized protein n=1 Tax=Desmospora profundinema TaxID=1571184 RepID=A0ABU1IRJ3_9BACL|nr:hypothetical protein [Desmospora profundinema]MDR6227043.1 hypothetical protein [Desmospora profundinema]
MSRIGWILLLVGLLIVGAGCGMLGSGESDADAEEQEETTEVATIVFGDYPQDEGNYEIIHPRKHFGRDEDVAMAFQMPGEKKFDVTRLKFQIIKADGDRVLQEMIEEVKPKDHQLKWEFTSSSSFHGFYETGDYQMKVWRGKDLLAEGDFIIMD